MKKIYNNNLQEIKKISLDIYTLIQKKNGEISVNIDINKLGQKNIIKKYNGKEFSVHSNYDVKAQSKIICDYALEDDKEVIVIFGMGFCYELKEIIKRAPNKKYIVIEPELEIFKLMIENVDFTKYLKGNYDIKFIIQQQEESICNDLIKKLNELNTWNIKLITLPFYRYMYKNTIDKILERIKNEILTEKVNISTTLNRDRQWVLNFAKNIQYLNEMSVIGSFGDIKNIPAIIVGAGPSVELNLSHLKKINKKALIIGAGNSAKILEENNIKADIIGAIDSSEETVDIYKNLNLNKDSILFYSSQVFSRIPGIFNGKKYLMNQSGMDNYINFKVTQKDERVVSGPSITNVLAYNLSLLGFSPIIFLGQDLCGKQKKLYAKGSIHDDDTELINKLNIETFNKKGEKVITNNAFLSMKVSMEHIIKFFPQIKYLNGTDGGLKIEGSKDIDFNDYVDKILIDLDDIDFECVEEIQSNNRNSIYNEIIYDIEQAKNIMEEALEFIQRENDNSKKELYINKTNDLLNENCFYKRVLNFDFGKLMDTLYGKRGYVEYNEKAYMYYLDKCNVMIQGLNSIKL